MKSERKIGISDMAFYLPALRMDLDRLARERSAQDPRLARHLERALRTTGQLALRFPQAGEDSATMAAEAADIVLRRAAARPGFDLGGLRHLVAGTETGLDHSKALSSYVAGMLALAGHRLPSTHTSFQVQQACAGGTLGLMGAAGMLAAFGRPGESALVVAADVARYRTLSTAEVTQGAGAAAVLVEESPRLLELDLAAAGFSSSDTDDFFRPLGSTVAQVDGRYSMECYNQALLGAVDDLARRSGLSVPALLESCDAFALHAPFANMPAAAMRRLLAERLGLGEAEADAYLAERYFGQGVEPVARIGNTYTASVFLVGAWLLAAMAGDLGAGMAGKRLLMASYGSGNTMVAWVATVAPDAAAVVAGWDLAALLAAGEDAAWERYAAWAGSVGGQADAPGWGEPKARGFRLASIREDGYRVYAHAGAAATAETARPALARAR